LARFSAVSGTGALATTVTASPATEAEAGIPWAEASGAVGGLTAVSGVAGVAATGSWGGEGVPWVGGAGGAGSLVGGVGWAIGGGGVLSGLEPVGGVAWAAEASKARAAEAINRFSLDIENVLKR
jgi:hypothetical protein